MRKYKEIKRKEVIYELDEWELIKKWAARFNITTSEYIRQSSLTDKITVSKAPGEWGMLINELKKIGKERRKMKVCHISRITIVMYSN